MIDHYTREDCCNPGYGMMDVASEAREMDETLQEILGKLGV